MRSINTFLLLLVVVAACSVLAAPSLGSTCPRTATIECLVDGDDSPESALRQVDEHALETMFCHTGCDAMVNYGVPHAFSTYVNPICSVRKDENKVEYKKYKSKDDKDDKSDKSDKARRSLASKRSESVQEMSKRDIDAYTVGSATFQFCCTDQHGNDYTKAAAKRIGLELSICKKL